VNVIRFVQLVFIPLYNKMLHYILINFVMFAGVACIVRTNSWIGYAGYYADHKEDITI